ncbi:hypothetical protein HYW40_00325 [Candidatus Curtissbacteria bacterium]|nr:hypothetical protein [Candidatus Curtissbacteria bacterium]
MGIFVVCSLKICAREKLADNTRTVRFCQILQDILEPAPQKATFPRQFSQNSGKLLIKDFAKNPKKYGSKITNFCKKLPLFLGKFRRFWTKNCETIKNTNITQKLYRRFGKQERLSYWNKLIKKP